MEFSDLRQSNEYGCYMEKIGWQVKKTDCQIFIKKIPLIPFSFIKVQRPNWPPDWKQLAKIAKKYRTVQIKIEPDLPRNQKNSRLIKTMKKYGYKQDRSPLLPTKTIWLDLTKTKEQLLKEMHHQTRYNIGKSEVRNPEPQAIRGDKITETQLREFYKIYQDNAKRQGFWGLKFKQLKSLIDSFGTKGYLLLVKQRLVPNGGLILLIHDQVAYYSHNGATVNGKKQLAPTLLTWQAIKLAQKLKCLKFDFEGISDPLFPITKKWQGFSRFKKGFGGKEIEYVGSFTKSLF